MELQQLKLAKLQQSDQSHKLAGIDLCSGIGGISLGLSDYVTPISFCEIEQFPREILKARMKDGIFPSVPIYEDVNKFPTDNYKNEVDIVYAGFPCQDISVAGKGAGLEGKRSSLFFKILTLAQKVGSPFLFLENVPAIRTRGLERVVGAITEAGYDSRWLVLSAASLGAPHMRERWFLLAHSPSFTKRRVLKERGRQAAITKLNGFSESLADASSDRCKESQPIGLSKDDQGFKDKSWWAFEPSVGRVVNGLPKRVDRLKALGNGVVPLQVKTAFEQLIGIGDERYFNS